jgi:hypothetical protein
MFAYITHLSYCNNHEKKYKNELDYVDTLFSFIILLFIPFNSKISKSLHYYPNPFKNIQNLISHLTILIQNLQFTLQFQLGV